MSFVFHYLGEGLFVPAATWRFAFSFVGFARNLLRRLTANGSFIFADTGVGMYIVNSLDCMGYPFS